ncbi:hypothetical protein K432DRAFT_445620 [Lepidopterella palustris CBS 459.81]|uniref:HRQ family protein 2 n=1 Tax=Lepidopterella palustris CBS 459.81 TaxID=1314670 RepID=A0A8E2E454_9PEZI|nr:hypothetical protein K432DRAFT_445620 [Lepidopterella palustris CBS 459.81]
MICYPSSGLPIFLSLFGIAWLFWRRFHGKDATQSLPPPQNLKPADAASAEAPYYQISPLPDFNWQTTPPLQIRPFKPKYHLTMALQKITLSELLETDSTYLERITLRRQLIKDKADAVVAANAAVGPAVSEFYEWMVGTYLPSRYPTMFQTAPATPDAGQKAGRLANLVTHEDIPLAAPTDTTESLKVLGAHIDTDFLFLLPGARPGATSEPEYKLEGFVTCFPSGFSTLAKLGLGLADIHAPVPGYGARLARSMDRFFGALAVGRAVKRLNWAVTTHADLFATEGTHLYPARDAAAGEAEPWPAEEEDVDIDCAVLRCERQTLHRLPRTRALVFAFKTYQYPLARIKEEGSGEELAVAVEGLGKGNAPGMEVYKRGVVWGRDVVRFLRA